MTVPIASHSSNIDLRTIPSIVPNHLGGQEAAAGDGRTFAKIDPATGRTICQVARSTAADVKLAVEMARNAQPAWGATTVVKRGDILRQIAMLMKEHRSALADLVAKETGKSRKDALGETDAAIEMGFFVAGEGRRFYGQTTTSAVPNKSAMVMRQPLGVAGLIIAANTPIAHVSWTPFRASAARRAAMRTRPDARPAAARARGVRGRGGGGRGGVYPTLHGLGEEAGAARVEHAAVG